jgi:hypothetical protein
MSHLQRTYSASSTRAALHSRELTCTSHSRSCRRSRGFLRPTRFGPRTVRQLSLTHPSLDLHSHSEVHILTQLYTRSIPRRRAAPHPRDASAAFASHLAKTLSSIKRRRKARYTALRDVTRDEDDLSVVGKGKGRATAAEQCPVCLQDVDGDLDVIAAHIDACLAHAELQRPVSSIDADADEDAPLNIEGYGGGDGDMWEESETPDGVRRLRLRAGARNGAIALGFAVGDRTVDDVDDEIDVEGDDLSAFGATNFTEVDILAEPCDSELSRPVMGRLAAEVGVDTAIERARHEKDSQALIAALESKVQLLVVRQQPPYSPFAYSSLRVPRRMVQRWGVASVSRYILSQQ